MTIIFTKNNNYLPISFQKSNYPQIINTITTLNNLEINREILNDQNLLVAYLKQYYHHLNDYPDSIVIIDNIIALDEIKIPYQLIMVNNQITLDKLEELLK